MKPCSVIIVDPSAAILRSTKRLLVTLGMVAGKTYSLRGALRRMAGSDAEVLLVDYSLWRSPRTATIRRRLIARTRSVVVMTPKGDPGYRTACLALGATVSIEKGRIAEDLPRLIEFQLSPMTTKESPCSGLQDIVRGLS